MRRRHFGVLILGALCACLLMVPALAAAELKPISSFGEYGEGAGQIRDPGGGAYAPDGDFYLADFENNRVDVFSPTGSFKFAFGWRVNAANESNVCFTESGCVMGGRVADAGAIDHPEDLVIVEGAVFVTDNENNRVDEFEEDGTFVRAFGRGVNEEDGSDVCDEASGCVPGSTSGEDASVTRPAGIAYLQGLLFVADSGNNRIDIFAPEEGQFFGAFGAGVAANGEGICGFNSQACRSGADGSEAGELSEPIRIAAAPEGALAIVDHGNRRVDLFKGPSFAFAFGAGIGPGGSSICTTESGCASGTIGSGPGALPNPTAITTDAAGNFYVGDSELSRVSEFTGEGDFIRAFGEGVANGAKAFQVCTTTCQEGIPGVIPGAIPNPYGLAIDPAGRLSVVEENGETGAELARVETFADVPATPPSTGTTTTPVSPAPIAAPAPTTGRFKLGKVVLDKKKGTATITVTPVAAGRFVLTGKGVKKVSVAAKAGHATKLKITATGKVEKELAKTGKAKVTVKIAFTPTGGEATTQTKKLTLKKTLG